MLANYAHKDYLRGLLPLPTSAEDPTRHAMPGFPGTTRVPYERVHDDCMDNHGMMGGVIWGSSDRTDEASLNAASHAQNKRRDLR